ncbi:hypothetical protein L208DRAFT_1391807 [Tricholoma matsutake]|nr:hypothetical protein L208DRAFT_1391807 [Tricholoma matsutake 945]
MFSACLGEFWKSGKGCVAFLWALRVIEGLQGYVHVYGQRYGELGGGRVSVGHCYVPGNEGLRVCIVYM